MATRLTVVIPDGEYTPDVKEAIERAIGEMGTVHLESSKAQAEAAIEALRKESEGLSKALAESLAERDDLEESMPSAEEIAIAVHEHLREIGLMWPREDVPWVAASSAWCSQLEAVIEEELP